MYVDFSVGAYMCVPVCVCVYKYECVWVLVLLLCVSSYECSCACEHLCTKHGARVFLCAHADMPMSQHVTVSVSRHLHVLCVYFM